MLEKNVAALTVWQPWAWAIIHGTKRIENRTWRTSYRGRLLIHAGATTRGFGEFYGRDGTPLVHLPDGSWLPPREQLVLKAIIGEVTLVDCVPLKSVRCNPFAEGPWCWVLENPKPIVPIYMSGAQGLWRVPVDLIALAACA